MTNDLWIALIAGGGLTGFFTQVIPGLYGWITGKNKRDRTATQQAWAKADKESNRRRQVEEELHQLRARVIMAGRTDLLDDGTRRAIVETIDPRNDERGDQNG